MNPISSDIVEKTWKRAGGMSPQEAPKMINLMGKQQPLVLAYLMAVGGDTLNQDERELLLYIGVVVWQIMSQGTTPLPKITEKTLDKVEGPNMKMLEYLESETETGFIETVKRIVKNYHQPEVLRYVLEALMEEREEGCLIRDKNKGIIVIYLKTVIDCFDKGES
ncbi:MAG: hypothetical protein COZ37_06755 [bacterium (Candidatus Ratteibacteria) CG_4_10_14_3_um_filter_41_18]|uniref:Uncharacterized protein n=3 Tax=Candidatus Ratteibacteria TaxID=2979319 RepID=A0A2M7YFA3_9BACT|nr:MAG: hypothetical protein COS11_06760 [bacterium (Candidatus Ratteibacteria) CG01_land_8_20_14_3_00_40_19]PIX76666.1 MAG: hypothetical protein COZ37_06755 [bacterium (Candidatus Ratteibacteria) CG_4_10_14_3_um_filter_41_18]PJA61645.1 MAG: hypothetical protein CO162_05290 [bacterium (Candidatus Ratteibacteria) CG_4_9_14_3_um_filter_41_21]